MYSLDKGGERQMKRKKLSEIERPFVCATLFYKGRQETMKNMKLAELKGAKAFELNLLPLEGNSDDEVLRDIFAFTERPVFTTFRRRGPDASTGKMIEFDGSEGDRMERQLEAIKLGSSGFDMEIDTFVSNRDSEDQFNFEDEEAVQKQKGVIERAHGLGGEVMISYHTFNKVLTPDRTVEAGKEIEERGADIAKIDCMNYSHEDTLETLRGVVALRKELNIPFVSFAMGEHSKLTRVVGPMLGSMLVYATVTKIPIDFLWHQPLIEDMDAVFKHTDWSITMQGRGDWTKR